MRRFGLRPGAILGGIALGIVIVFSIAFVRAKGLLTEHLQEARRILETFPEETQRRPAIFEPEEPGNAWELEAKALDLLEPFGPLKEDPPHLHRLVGIFDTVSAPVEPEEMARVIVAAEPSFDLVRQALHRVRVTPQRRPGGFTHSSAGNAFSLLLTSASRAHEHGNDLFAAERLVLVLGWAGDVARHGDLEHYELLWEVEREGARVARDILGSHAFSGSDLETVSRWLDRLAAARPSLFQAIRVDSALERMFVIDPAFEAAVFVSDGLGPTKPAWRDLWCPTLHDARRVSALARAVRAHEGLAGLPPWKRQEAARVRLDALDLRACQSRELPREDLYFWDALARTCMDLLRIGVAVAWYEVEQGRFPERLESLVPRYLPSIGMCPLTGRPFVHESGGIRVDAASIKNPFDEEKDAFPAGYSCWSVRRKSR